MSKSRYICALCLLLCSMAVSAQTYERVLRGNLWNDSQNITGVRQDTVSRSYAELFAGYEGGEFRDPSQARQDWSAGAVTASIRHLEKMTLKGSFSFIQTEGYDMCGSMSIHPGFYPVDVLEFTPGRKTLQTYAFDGGISYDLTPGWRIGAMMDFEAANMAKRKDLRHENWWLDMIVSPGVMYHAGDFAVGVNYVFRKTSETIKADQVGASESSYYAFLDKGMMYGVYAPWTGSGLHLHESGVNSFPVKDFSNGAALQMQYKGLFAEAEYLHTSGVIGEKEYIWFLFPGDAVNARIGYRHIGRKAQHYARLGFGWKGRELDENVLEKVTSNGVATVIQHGSNNIASENTWTLSPEYEFVSDKVEVLAFADVNIKEKLSSQMYPYIYTQSLLTWNAGLKALFHVGSFDLGAHVGYGAGSVTEEDKTLTDASGVQTSPYRLQDWYDLQMAYTTAQRLGAGLSLRYNFWKGLYVEAAGSMLHGVGLATPASRYAVTLKLGYDF